LFNGAQEKNQTELEKKWTETLKELVKNIKRNLGKVSC